MENKVQSEINVCGKRSVEQMEDQNKMKREQGDSYRGRGEERSWNKRKYLATYDVSSKSRVMLREIAHNFPVSG